MLALADPWSILLLALALDAILGDPRWLYRALPHPVVLMGRAVAALEARWNDPALAIPWPLDTPLLSKRDAEAPTLAEVQERLIDWVAPAD